MKSSLGKFVDRLTVETRLTEVECDALCAVVGEVQHIEAHKPFVLLGDDTVSTCLVIDGFCCRVEMPTDDSRQITAIYLRGDMPDLYSAFQPRAKVSIEAMTPATILRIPHKPLRDLMAVYPAIMEAFSRYLVNDAAITTEWLGNVGGRDARASLAHLYCEMAVRLGVDEGQRFNFSFPVSQAQLAETTGLSVVHVNRSLMALRRDGLMTVDRGHVQVLDWDSLVSAASFSTLYLDPGPQMQFAN